MNKKRDDKRAVSPVVATVLLIMIVVILAIIILIWSQGFIKDIVSKEIAGTKKRAEAFCGEVSLSPIINGDEFGFENRGVVPIYNYIVRTTRDGNVDTQEMNAEDHHVNPGFMEIIEGYDSYDSYEKVEIIPILLGKSKTGQQEEFPCPERYAIIL